MSQDEKQSFALVGSSVVLLTFITSTSSLERKKCICHSRSRPLSQVEGSIFDRDSSSDHMLDVQNSAFSRL